MRSSFFLSALMLATVHSCSRSVSVDNTAASSVGGGVVSSSVLAFESAELKFEFALEFESALFMLTFELLRRSTFALRFAFVLDALIIRGTKTTAAIPSPANTMTKIAKIPRIQGHVWRLRSPSEPGGTYE